MWDGRAGDLPATRAQGTLWPSEATQVLLAQPGVLCIPTLPGPSGTHHQTALASVSGPATTAEGQHLPWPHSSGLWVVLVLPGCPATPTLHLAVTP